MIRGIPLIVKKFTNVYHEIICKHKRWARKYFCGIKITMNFLNQSKKNILQKTGKI